jgi:hypothetical protein
LVASRFVTSAFAFVPAGARAPERPELSKRSAVFRESPTLGCSVGEPPPERAGQNSGSWLATTPFLCTVPP